MADWILTIIAHGAHFSGVARLRVVVQFDGEASQTRDYSVAKTRRIARLARSLAAQRTLARDDDQTEPLRGRVFRCGRIEDRPLG